MRHQILTQAKRVVVKVGSSLLASRASGLQFDRSSRLPPQSGKAVSCGHTKKRSNDSV
jgi:glutamate 5-kinase